jgi:hypothetical protein
MRSRAALGLPVPHGCAASFPAGHADYAGATSVALLLLFTVLGSRRRWWWALAVLGVLGMAWSRTYLHVHWFRTSSADRHLASASRSPSSPELNSCYAQRSSRRAAGFSRPLPNVGRLEHCRWTVGGHVRGCRSERSQRRRSRFSSTRKILRSRAGCTSGAWRFSAQTRAATRVVSCRGSARPRPLAICECRCSSMNAKTRTPCGGRLGVAEHDRGRPRS